MPPKVELGRKATYQDVLDAPAHLVAEIMGGDLYLRERPAPRTGLAMSRLSAGLQGAFALGRSAPDPLFVQDWWILREPELRLGGQILAPDLVGWRRERMERLPDTQYLTLAPDWVCQVLSTEQHRRELPDRRRLYARERVRHLWLVHLAERALEAFELRHGGWVPIATAKDDEPVSIRPFDAITFSLGDLWS